MNVCLLSARLHELNTFLFTTHDESLRQRIYGNLFSVPVSDIAANTYQRSYIKPSTMSVILFTDSDFKTSVRGS